MCCHLSKWIAAEFTVRLIQFITSFLLTGAFIKTSFMQGFFCWKLDRFIHILFTFIHSQYSPYPRSKISPVEEKSLHLPLLFARLETVYWQRLEKEKDRGSPQLLCRVSEEKMATHSGKLNQLGNNWKKLNIQKKNKNIL